jgi:hypothetical protein
MKKSLINVSEVKKKFGEPLLMIFNKQPSLNISAQTFANDFLLKKYHYNPDANFWFNLTNDWY